MQSNTTVWNMLGYIPPLIKNKKLFVLKNESEITIKIVCRGHSNTLSVSRFLPINEKNLMAFGFAEAEMGKSPSIDYFGVVNSEEYPLLIFKRFAERLFFIRQKSWKVYVVYSRPRREPAEVEHKIKKWWSQKLGVDRENIYVDWQRSKKEGELLGSARLYVYNKDLKEIFLEILKKLKTTVRSNPKFVLWYLKGKELGDGTVVLRKRGSIHNFGMTSSNLNELEEDRELYELVGISLSCPKFRVIRAGNVESLTTAVQDGHFSGSLPRRLKLLNGFLAALEVRTAYKYLKILSRIPSLNINKIADKARVTRQSAHYFLQKAIKLKWVRREFTVTKFMYFITEKGLQVIDLFEKATKERVKIDNLYKRKQRDRILYLREI